MKGLERGGRDAVLDTLEHLVPQEDVAGQSFVAQSSRDVDGPSQQREVEPIRASDVAEHGLSLRDADAWQQRIGRSGGSRVVELLLNGLGAAEGGQDHIAAPEHRHHAIGDESVDVPTESLYQLGLAVQRLVDLRHDRAGPDRVAKRREGPKV